MVFYAFNPPCWGEDKKLLVLVLNASGTRIPSGYA